MRTHITNLYGQSSESTAMISQNMTAQVARELGINELGIYNYPITVDSPGELSTRLDGIIASVSAEDIVILQLPTWNSLEFEQALVNKLKSYRNVKIAIYLHDVVPLQFKSNYYLMAPYIELFNQVDCLIVPSENMKNRLIEEGLTIENIIIQQMWDHPIAYDLSKTTFKREIHFAGNAEKFDFVKDWAGDIPLKVYSNPIGEDLNEKTTYLGWHSDAALVSHLSEGGFGLVWTENPDIQEYFALCNSYKLGTYLAAGIPVIVPRNLSNAQLIKDHQLGYIVDSLEEADTIVAKIDTEEYEMLKENVANFAFLLRTGQFTKKVLTDTIHQIILKK
ncbi:sugar transferase [Vagococcus lutrae]|uniref:sugar transferase n=1 Tax=Vagococcus lutrae TaxID=81947 RepID=UPI00288F4E61|nr:sugar transferase [Vagococcus lutrae]MDT2806871.1 sugar transferase [Vagococcus lutrae]MDT2818068.1 sugar transferase [Vagococcus lutrae]MDT2842957.1 sugar transferase [Vagococcus lutrae]